VLFSVTQNKQHDCPDHKNDNKSPDIKPGREYVAYYLAAGHHGREKCDAKDAYFFHVVTVAPHGVKVRAMVFDIYPANYPAEGANHNPAKKNAIFKV
jgi:hypothetical protein